MSEQWYISRGGQQRGPYSWQQVTVFGTEGNIKSDDLLWSQSTGRWVRADSITGLLRPTGTASPTPQGAPPVAAELQQQAAASAVQGANYKILGTVMPVVEIRLRLNERLYAQSGAMQWMDPNMKMEAEMKGGVMGALKRGVSGESMFVQNFTPLADGAMVAFGHSFPGNIIPMNIGLRPIICQKRSFLCAYDTVSYDLHINKRIGAGFFGGEGFIMQKLAGRGTAFLEIDGECVEKQLAPGQSIKVATGAVGAFEETVQFNIEMVKGVKNMFLGGEGLFLTTLTGPGKVWIQTMPISGMSAELFKYMPKSK